MTGDSVPQVDIGRSVATVRQLAAQFPGRLSGSATQHDAAHWFLNAFRDAGLDAHIETFRSLNSGVVPARLEIVQPVSEVLTAQTLGYSRSTPPGGLDLRLADAGAGGGGDYPEAATGNAALVNGYEGPATPEKARAAIAHGAAALVYVSPPARSRELAFRAIKSIWGVPTPEELRQVPRLPGVAVSYEDGQHLRQLLGAGGQVAVRLRAEQPEPAWDELHDVVATVEPDVPGGPREYVLVHAHLDSWDPGITDNLTGDVLALELARSFQAAAGRRRGLIFCLWDGHEIAEASGSSWYVERHWDFVRDHVVCQVNIDSPGIIDARRVLARQTPEMLRFQQRTHDALGLADVAYAGLDRSFDQSFFGAGIPGCLVFGGGGGAAGGGLPVMWYTHTRSDTVEQVAQGHFALFATIYASYLRDLIGAARLPFDFHPYLDRLEQAMARWSAAGTVQLDVEPLQRGAAALRGALGPLERMAAADFNDRARRLARVLLGGLYTTVGPHRQDRYGCTEFSAPFPAVAHLDALVAATALPGGVPPWPPAPLESWLAAALRERNRLGDTLGRAREVLA